MNASSNKKRISTVLILAAILVMPGFLYYLLQDQGKNRYKPLAIFGPKQVAATFHSVRGKQIPDTIYHVVDDFSLVNQVGDTVTLDNWKGKIVVVNLLYNQVQTDGSKAIFTALKGFNKAYTTNRLVSFASISVDPRENIEKLNGWAKILGAIPKKWDLLEGDSSVVYPLVRKGLLLDVIEVKTPEKKTIYSHKIVLLDTKHRIRGFYEISNHEAISKLEDEIKVLIAEELRNMRDGR
ncbi:MAG: redoxin domain-containing protein [Flavobacteriales bacterium]|nr:MAG: redoxin domain-containing protein [Flavobacteriales bacterium]